MTDEQQKEKRPLSMTRRYRRGLVLVGLLCMLATLAAATLLFQRSYTGRVDAYLGQVCDSVAAGYKAQASHDAATLADLLPENDAALRFTLIDGDGTVLFDSEAGADLAALPSHADRPEVIAALADGSASVTRESQTMQEETHYYARRIDTPDGVQVLRVGEDVATLWGLSADTLPLLCCAVVLILLATAVLAWWLTRRLVQPINHLAENLDTIEADVPYEELIPLARTIQTDRKLREDNETMRREFTANVSHELKTPLTSISGYAELIETGMAKSADVTELATNLCDNAIRYNQPGGHVELRCGTGPDGPWLQVEDNGIGIPQDSQARVFERFYRVDKSRSKATGGTGLGLAIVKHIALLHHARIDLQSQVGSGTTIKVTFPKA